MKMNGHEYCVQNGYNRSHVGKYVYSFATILSWLMIYASLKIFGELSVYWNTAISTLTTGILFVVTYFLFEKWIWKTSLFFKILKYPDISGDWSCEGESSFQIENKDMVKVDFKWKGKVKILQSWDKVRIRIETENSVSNSISAAIVYDELDEYKVLYSYENVPKDLDHDELRTHRGFAELTLSRDNESANVKYYNINGRKTIGNMLWTKLNS